MRGGITRRQPRNSLRASANNNSRLQHDEDGGSDRGTPTGQWSRRMTISSQDTAGGASSALGVSPVNLRDSRFGLNTASWQGTGVINNLPPRMSDASASTRMTPANAVQHSAHAKDQDSQDDAKAAELALRELLDSLEAARYLLLPCPYLLVSMLTRCPTDAESRTRISPKSRTKPCLALTFAP
jgi:hypothetical protein